VPAVELWQEGSRYFQWHHSPADTFDKVVGPELLLATGAYAVLAWQLAEQPETLPRPPPPTDPPWWSKEPLPPPAGVLPPRGAEPAPPTGR
jgi:hypothetical protein